MMDEFDEYMDLSYKDKVIDALETAIKFKCPGIKNLRLTRTSDHTMTAEFDDGPYSKEDILNTIKEITEFKI